MDIYIKVKQEGLSNRVEHDSKDDVAKGLAVIKRSEHENEMQDDVCGHAKDGPNEVNDEESGSVCWRE